ncbi:hypothetical protein BD626DRAFT_515369 [Schizophyllum amplum]|uniref:BTB domain-containing protein n=1 Tax=Schizophyllum amplum TaxID=97359 RepID=A0A550BXR0_9AGAR|nr:hypothetical protein BD626DRAFT_515369 [Auriculariopsis ampla]
MAAIASYPAHTSESPTPRQSEQYRSTEGDVVIFRSADGVLFNIHRANLSVFTDGPFAVDFPSEGDVVELSESEATLGYLFQFVYSGRHPLLTDVPFDSLRALAEAAEKYQVSPAMSVCYMRMSTMHKEHPLAVLQYADRHAYVELMDLAAPYTLGLSVKDMRNSLSLSTQIAWADYKETWTSVRWRSSADIGQPPMHVGRKGGEVRCDIWPAIARVVQSRVDSCQRPPMLEIDAMFVGMVDVAKQCTHDIPGSWGNKRCSQQLGDWRSALEDKVRELPQLSQCLSVAEL